MRSTGARNPFPRFSAIFVRGKEKCDEGNKYRGDCQAAGSVGRDFGGHAGGFGSVAGGCVDSSWSHTQSSLVRRRRFGAEENNHDRGNGCNTGGAVVIDGKSISGHAICETDSRRATA